MYVKLIIIFCAIFFASCFILSAESKRNYNFENLNDIHKRYPRCATANCGWGGSWWPLFNQGFFNCGGRCHQNCGGSCKPPSVSNTSNVTSVVANKTKIFTAKFDVGNSGLDFYYLMDATGTFKYDRQVLAALAPNLIKSIQILAPDSQIGFGLFSNKVGGSSYGLYNKMSLTSNTSRFASIVGSTANVNTGAQSDPEDALSGLHQVAACTSEINWRKGTLRMLLLTTDEDYRIDSGKLKPFDGGCHIDANGLFGGKIYNDFDFPTVEHVKDAVKKNTIRVIFAIKEIRIIVPSVPDIYRALAARIAPKPIVLTLEANSANIIKVVEQAYKEATSNVVLEITLNGIKSIVEQAEISAKCMKNASARNNEFASITSYVSCTVPVNGQVVFQIQVTLPCPFDTKDVTLKANVQGYSLFEDIDLTNFCN